MLGSAAIVAFAATRDVARAKTFYADALGLELVHEDGFALVFDAHGTTLRVSRVEEVTVAPYTVLGWEVTDATATVTALAERSVEFERFEGMDQDELGIWTTPDGGRVAWFKDPDGSTLSITQLPDAAGGP